MLSGLWNDVRYSARTLVRKAHKIVTVFQTIEFDVGVPNLSRTDADAVCVRCGRGRLRRELPAVVARFARRPDGGIAA